MRIAVGSGINTAQLNCRVKSRTWGDIEDNGGAVVGQITDVGLAGNVNDQVPCDDV